ALRPLGGVPARRQHVVELRDLRRHRAVLVLTLLVLGGVVGGLLVAAGGEQDCQGEGAHQFPIICERPTIFCSDIATASRTSVPSAVTSKLSTNAVIICPCCLRPAAICDAWSGVSTRMRTSAPSRSVTLSVPNTALGFMPTSASLSSRPEAAL